MFKIPWSLLTSPVCGTKAGEVGSSTPGTGLDGVG